MNHLHLQLAHPVDIDPDDVLRDYGIDTNTTSPVVTVIQRNNNIATVTQQSVTVTQPLTAMLEPPSLDIVNSDATAPPVGTFTDEAIETVLTEAAVYPDEEEREMMEENFDEDEAVVQDILDEQPSAEETTPEEPQNTLIDVSTLSEEELAKLLPVNSQEFNFDDSTSRFSGAAWYKAIQEKPVVLAGLGGIGSWTLLILSRMKPYTVYLYDDDIVETANLSGQAYMQTMVGRTKVDAMAAFIKDFSIYQSVVAIPQKFTETSPAGDIMICGFDNMSARKTFFNVWFKHVQNHTNPEKCLFIDGRLNLEEFQVFCIQGTDNYNMQRYIKEYLFSDNQASSEVCSMKQTTYCSNMIASVMVNLYTNFVANALKPLIPRDLPFKTYYDASMMYLKTEM